jgi:hypothetical protein
MVVGLPALSKNVWTEGTRTQYNQTLKEFVEKLTLSDLLVDNRAIEESESGTGEHIRRCGLGLSGEL